MKKRKKQFNKKFHGEYLELLLKVKSKATQETADGVYEVDTPVKVRGYLLGEDTVNYYMGDADKLLSASVLKEQVIMKTIIKIADPMDTMLDNMPTNGQMN